jgi:hypothetical protein
MAINVAGEEDREYFRGQWGRVAVLGDSRFQTSALITSLAPIGPTAASPKVRGQRQGAHRSVSAIGLAG